MKGIIVYIEGHKESSNQARDSLNSFLDYGWDVQLSPGITPKTVESYEEFNIPLKKDSRLNDFKQQDYKKFLTKVSCVINHIKFWQKVVEADEPMCFLEHDSICISAPPKNKFREYLLLNAEYVFRPPNKLGIQKYAHFSFSPLVGINDFPFNYPLKYYRKNEWNNSNMAPGTAAYGITPKGASKMLSVASKALDQSDFIINSHNIDMQYVYPSPVKFNRVNLDTSHGF